MAIRSAKNIIREARIQSGMTQEEMADGICSLQALSREALIKSSLPLCLRWMRTNLLMDMLLRSANSARETL